ncbi:MAG: acyl-CoA dehydratase activase [Pseudomonadota bacterium]
MDPAQTFLGIDVGSVAVSIVELTPDMSIINAVSTLHHGDIRSGLAAALKNTDLTKISLIAATSATPATIVRDLDIDDQVAIIKAGKHLHPDMRSLINVGGEKFSLSLFDLTGSYIGAKNNTSCAAGTGSFLDQQASRLGLGSTQDLSAAACSNIMSIPDIATRCAVFAKTDLIHAQQEGFTVPQICDGLCKGLAKNIINTLFTSRKAVTPVVFCGGVSKNQSVRRHLESLLGLTLVIDQYSHLYGALGAALTLCDADINAGNTRHVTVIDDIYRDLSRERRGLSPELSLSLSTYPDFDSIVSYVRDEVEYNIFIDPKTVEPQACYLGIDVGSTSTKSVLLTLSDSVLAGFYTKTASRPVEAVKKIIKAAQDFIQDNNLSITISGCGTTGSGRKLSGHIIGADIVLDEISAHARAAFAINPQVDTIIEIGGQDAKFTTLKNGVVTSSVMNNVCAAGTGSFIEEQALKLDCPLSQYSKRTESLASPISSDRCTVFMERDINHFLSEGFSVNEVLASALHSVRDNYLAKVANLGRIGNTILFQGATARNKALVAAFEQKLNKPIQVSLYCHLTGALGVALTLMDQGFKTSQFRGFDLWRHPIPVRQETCQLCTNHCKLTIAEIGSETAAYGFLCGRDYDTQRFVANQPSFHLLKARDSILKRPAFKAKNTGFTLGIPAALHLVEDLRFWEVFFDYLDIRTITSRKMKSPISKGKAIANAEFCTPMTAMHGHVAFLLEKADYIFLPFYFENQEKEKNTRRQYCYYTQYLPSVIASLPDIDGDRLISPVIKYLYTSFHTKLQLYKALKKIPGGHRSFLDISSAFDKALEWKKQSRKRLKDLYASQVKKSRDIDIILVGRPYTVLSETLNAGIPDIVASMNINLFFQDMIDLGSTDFSPIAPLLNEIHWEHAATILKTTLTVARTENLYPVYITSFKCSPDSFGVDYFKQIMEAHNKPYLVLELDEHDSNIGYETRIEAAVRAFRNHRNTSVPQTSIHLSRVNPCLEQRMTGKTIVFPNWDPITGALLAATLRGEGYDVLLMEETHDTIKKSLKTNTGQCIPLNAIASGFARTIRNHDLDPGDTVLWLSRSDIACNIKMYPHHIKTLLSNLGPGMDRAGVYKGELFFSDISIKASVNAYFAYMFGGLIRSLGCKLRPYECITGETDRAIENAVVVLGKAFEGERSKEDALAEAVSRFAWIRTVRKERPKVGIFGDFYVRDNDIMNQDLIHFIEVNGGEVVSTPYYRFAKMIADSYFQKWFKEGKYLDLLSNKALLTAMSALEKKYYRYFEHLLNDPDPEYNDSIPGILAEYGLLPEHTGESMDNLIKIHYTIKEHPDLTMFVQTSPAFCCPGLITEAMATAIERKTGIPIVSVTYDALEGNRNRVLIPFLHYSRERSGSVTFRKSI